MSWIKKAKQGAQVEMARLEHERAEALELFHQEFVKASPYVENGLAEFGDELFGNLLGIKRYNFGKQFEWKVSVTQSATIQGDRRCHSVGL